MAPEAHCSSPLQNLPFKLSPSACHPPTSCPALPLPGVTSTSSLGPDRLPRQRTLCSDRGFLWARPGLPESLCTPVMSVLKGASLLLSTRFTQ